MRVLGVDIISADLRWIILDGSNRDGSLEIVNPGRQRLPASENDEVGNLLQLKYLVINAIRQNRIDKVGIIRAGNLCSPLRCKAEFIVQYACKDLGIPCLMIAPQTVRAAQDRKVHEVTGSSLAQAYNSGNQINPKYLQKAAYCAWSVLNAG